MNDRPVSVAPVFSGYSLPGTEHSNHDRWGARCRTVWVIDGATRTATTPVEKYVAALDTALTDVAAHDSLPLTELLALAIARVADEYRGMCLSATVALARQRTHGGWDWLVLGDSAVAFDDDDGTHFVQDTRLACVGVAQRARKRAIEHHAANGSNLMEAQAALLTAEDAARNVRGGFWVAADRPDAAMHALTGSIDAKDLVLMTDGAVSGLAAGTWGDVAQMVHEMLHTSPEQVLQLIRQDVIAANGRADDMTLARARTL